MGGQYRRRLRQRDRRGVYSGSGTDTLTITGATAAMSGYQYEAVFSNSAGSATTTPASLSVQTKLYWDAARNAANMNTDWLGGIWDIGSAAGPTTTWIPGSDAVIPESSVAITIGSGETVAANSVTFLGNGDSVGGGTFDLGTAGGTIDVEGNSNSATVSSTIIGSWLTKVGSGVLVLSGENTYTGTTTLCAGTVNWMLRNIRERRGRWALPAMQALSCSPAVACSTRP